MSSTYDNLIFRSGNNGLTLQLFSDIGCRKSKPFVDQKATEEYVLSIHKQLMVIGAYQSLSFSLDDILSLYIYIIGILWGEMLAL